MQYVNYREMGYTLQKRADFNGNSVYATTNNGNYEVYSYNTLIFKIEGARLYFNNKYYSKTTSKLQNILIDTFGLNGGVHKRD